MVLPTTKMGLPENSLASDWPALWPLTTGPGPGALSPSLFFTYRMVPIVPSPRGRNAGLGWSHGQTSGTNTEWGSPCWHLRARELP